MDMVFSEVYALKGGWTEWITAQFPTEKKGAVK
jgi:3-mercaptopyruvate sulfurtransferase SseA